MTKEEYSQLCRSHGFTQAEGTRFVGWERGYFVTVQYAGKNSISVTLPTRDGDRKKYAGDFKRELRSRLGSAVSARWLNGEVSVFLSVKKLPDVYCQGVTAALDVLKGLGFTAPDACKVCGRSGCDAAVPNTAFPQAAAFLPVHRACLESAVAGARTKADDNRQSGSYLLGFVGAFLGMLVGILPSAFSMIALSRVYSILFMLIPLLSYVGYRLFRGRMNYAALVLSVLFSALGVFILNYMNVLWADKEALGLTFAQMLSLVGPAVTDRLVLRQIVSSENFTICLVFIALGIFLAWSRISRTAKTDVKDAQAVLASAIPYAAPTAGLAYDPADYQPDTDAVSDSREE